MSSSLLLALIPTFFFVSITPGMCMTLALTLGMTVGIRRTMWMMVGELLGIQLWRSKGKMAIDLNGTPTDTGRLQLASQGFITAVANPKGWAFFVALLPPFIDPNRQLLGQMVMLLSVILTIEAMSLMVYALGGRSLSKLLQKSGNVRLMNRVAGSLMMGVAAWLALG